ncbi:MAG: AAA family ATPase [Marinilabiliaceae bacterium]|nr:AAA family ATPase [Marinilabiliaceae bacterium]
MIFLEKFLLPSENRRVYPFRILYSKMLEIVSFAPVTIFYGSNGSGKSTLLNVIAEKIELRYKTIRNSSLYFNEFVEKCTFETATRNEKPLKIPFNSRLIRSEDIMESIVNLRKETVKAENKIVNLQNLIATDSEDGVKYKLMGEKEMKPAMENLNKISEQSSNGESAMHFFENIFEPDTLYLLDEPENSLSPQLQIALKELIEKKVYLFGCQFIIATHSPLLLSISNATVYNLDRCPTTICNWFELENVRVFYDFFIKNRELFEKEDNKKISFRKRKNI